MEKIHTCAGRKVPPVRTNAYALGSRRREERYREAFRSDAFWAWLRSLTPMQRAHARAQGLLEPRVEGCFRGLSLEELPSSLLPACQAALPVEEARDESASPGGRALTPQEKRLLRDFLCEEGKPALRKACLHYLCGRGSCAEHARRLGISKQLFHYHMRKLQRRLGFSRVSGQRRGRDK